MRAVYESITGQKRLFQHDGGHSCFRDLDGRRITDQMVAWFDETLAGSD